MQSNEAILYKKGHLVLAANGHGRSVGSSTSYSDTLATNSPNVFRIENQKFPKELVLALAGHRPAQ